MAKSATEETALLGDGKLDYSFDICGVVPWLTDLSNNVGYRLLVALFFVEHVMRGFVAALTAQSVNFLYASYSVPAPTMSIYSGVVSLPWALKPIIGLASDLFPIGGYNKMPYMIIMSLFGCVAYSVLGFLPQAIVPITFVVVALFGTQMQLSTCDILAEAKYAEKIREVPAYGPHILSFVWFGMNFGDLIGTGMSGFVISIWSPNASFAIALIPAFLVMIPIGMNYLQESSMSHEELKAQRARFYKQKEACFLCVMMFLAILAVTVIGLLSADPKSNCIVAGTMFILLLISFSVVLSPTIACFNAWSFLQTSCSVSTAGAGFYFMTDTPLQYPEGPHFSMFFYTSVLGTFASVLSLIGVASYQKYASTWRYRNLLLIINVLLGLYNLIDILFYTRLNVRWGVPDHAFVLSTSVISGILGQWQWMPQVIILSYLCPKGMEATMYALLAGCHNLGNVVAANFSALMLDGLGITPDGSPGESAKFENLWKASLISAFLPLVPIVALFKLVPDVKQGDAVIEADEDATTGSLLNRWLGNSAQGVPSQQETVDAIVPLLLKKGVRYRKFKKAFVKQAVAGEKVQTILNGKLETENQAQEGDFIVRADTTSKERYILKPDTFASCYDSANPMEIDSSHPDASDLAAEGFKAYAPTRTVLALDVDAEILMNFPEGKFMAAWGEPMVVEAGDFLASGKTLADGQIVEIIRIEKDAFSQTYSTA